MKKIYNQSVEDVLEDLDVTKEGLSTKQVLQMRSQYGVNKLQEEKAPSIISVFLSQFKDLLVIILIISAVISIFSGHVESAVVIIIVIVVNAILGTVQYIKAEKSLQSLKNMAAPMAKVIRDGQKMEILASDIVVGDIVMLEAGDIVPADGRVVDNYSLQVNESSLTGESESVNKTVDQLQDDNLVIGNQVNMVFSGCFVTYGRAYVVITAVGMNTEIGKIASLMNATKQRKTPLQVSLDDFSKKLSFGIIIISVIIFGLQFYRQTPIMDALMFAVALAVAAIPEALSSIVTIALAIGTSKMAKQNAIIKELKAVEGLGSVSIICSDKTGTLTQNKMTVQSVFPSQNSQRTELISILCNDSFMANGQWCGDPTETALTNYYNQRFDDLTIVQNKYPRLAEIPFDSTRKLMSTLQNVDNHNIMFTKGAVDMLINKIDSILDNGVIRPITENDKKWILDENNDMSNNGLRVLAFVQKVIESNTITIDDECHYTFVGLISMIDPPRIESKQAVSDCKMAGIKPIMITGDHKVTASAIAASIGILSGDDIALDGQELEALSDDQLIEVLPKVAVYARVSPEHKIRIVSAWQQLGNIVAMTGDGVNDAPALKKADIGIAMGITGTAVSKDAASVILTDDNFATIIKAVENGRNIYANIKNAIKFLLSGNMAGIIVVLYTVTLALPIPFAAVHLLFINLLTDSLPAIAISMENSSKALLKEKPRDKNEGILTKAFIIDISWMGGLIGIATIIAYSFGLKTDGFTASTMAFATLCLARLFHGFNLRGERSLFKMGIMTNKYSIMAFVLGVILLAIVLFVPALKGVMAISPLSNNDLMVILACAVVPTIIIQIVKVIKEH